MRLVRLIKMYKNDTYSKVHIGRSLFHAFPTHHDLKEGDALSPLL